MLGFRVRRESAVSGVPSVSSGELISDNTLGITLLGDVSRPGAQEDVVSSWAPAHGLVEDACLWG